MLKYAYFSTQGDMYRNTVVDYKWCSKPKKYHGTAMFLVFLDVNAIVHSITTVVLLCDTVYFASTGIHTFLETVFLSTLANRVIPWYMNVVIFPLSL